MAPLWCLLGACGGADSGDGSPPPTSTTPDPSPGPSATVTSVVVEHLASSAEDKVPVTFGQAFAPGDLPAGSFIAGRDNNGTVVPLQADVKATHADGSIRHAILSGVLPAVGANESRTLSLGRSSAATAGPAITPQALVAAGFRAAVTIELGGQTYRASADEALLGASRIEWLSGPIATEWLLAVPFRTAAGTAHPHLMARFAVRAYAGLDKARVDVIVENNWAYEPAPQNFTYKAVIDVGGSPAFTQDSVVHYHHARWRKTLWWGSEPQVHLRHDNAYLMATRAIPNYDRSVTVTTDQLAALANRWASAKKGLMAPGLVVTYMPTTGGRPDIGPLPQWSATYVLTMDRTAKATVLGTGDLAGSWPIHYRNQATDLPVTVADYPYMTLLGRPGDTNNPVTKKSEAFPACGGICTTEPYQYSPDSAHQPSLAYLPYLITGDHYYLEELHFWTNYNTFKDNPGYRMREQGLLKSDQVRAQAWSLRTLGQAAYITPDNHPLKSHFVQMVHNNINWYTSTFVAAQPNALGFLGGTGVDGFQAIVYTTASGANTGMAPWQDDFFTWSVGYLVELGFQDAAPLLAWKAKFPVGRMTAPGYCWIDGATYALAVRPSATAAPYGTFAEAYQATMRSTDANGMPVPRVNSTGAKYLDQPCASQAQADWLTRLDMDNHASRSAWKAGEMTGYASSDSGYPSNMQPALAVAADSGIPQAAQAWSMFINRSVKPDYGTGPQFAIVPRQ
ncbi:hypothetical protein [Ideonella sp. BN130291]|uniref:RIFT barrel domain-containing protein n=1 Tax=Ideonella sp. BN130291 TaxID=3112940 RepID=UPI002E271A9C|nr:hypothetical protein [Ideonella sp. BN130291]